MGRLLLAASLVLGLPAVAAGSPASGPPEEAPAPSLALARDPAPPHPAWGLGLDPLALAFGRYGVHLEVAPARAHALWMAPAWARGEGLSVELGYHLWPVGRGLSGPFLGPVVEVVLAGRSRVGAVSVAAEAGYQHVWSGLTVGAAVGVAARWDDPGAQGPVARARLRVRLALGWAWSG
ncbi:MAG: hypothetical protein ACODAU_13400 [Myxococcota bacterium]